MTPWLEAVKVRLALVKQGPAYLDDFNAHASADLAHALQVIEAGDKVVEEAQSLLLWHHTPPSAERITLEEVQARGVHGRTAIERVRMALAHYQAVRGEEET